MPSPTTPCARRGAFPLLLAALSACGTVTVHVGDAPAEPGPTATVRGASPGFFAWLRRAAVVRIDGVDAAPAGDVYVMRPGRHTFHVRLLHQDHRFDGAAELDCPAGAYRLVAERRQHGFRLQLARDDGTCTGDCHVRCTGHDLPALGIGLPPLFCSALGARF